MDTVYCNSDVFLCVNVKGKEIVNVKICEDSTAVLSYFTDYLIYSSATV